MSSRVAFRALSAMQMPVPGSSGSPSLLTDPSPTEQFSASPAPWVPGGHLQDLSVAVEKDALMVTRQSLLLAGLWVPITGVGVMGVMTFLTHRENQAQLPS